MVKYNRLEGTYMKKILIAVLLFLLTACGAQIDPSTDEPTHTVSAIDLYEEFRVDTLNAFAKYEDVVTEVKGVIHEIHHYDEYSTIDFYGNVQCKLNGQYDDIKLLQKYDIITIRGIVDNGHLETGVFLVKCDYVTIHVDIDYEMTIQEYLDFEKEEDYLVVDVTGEVKRQSGNCIDYKSEESIIDFYRVCVRENSMIPEIEIGDIVTIRVFYYSTQWDFSNSGGLYIVKHNGEEVEQPYTSQP